MQSLSIVTSKNIAVRGDVVKKLDRAKRAGESYSDVIDRYLADPSPLLESLDYLEKHSIPGPDTLGPRLRRIREAMNRSFDARWLRRE